MSKKSIILSLSVVLIIALAAYVFALGDASGESKELNIDLVPPEVFDYTSIYSMFTYENEAKYNLAEEGSFSLQTSQSRYKNRMDGSLLVYNLQYLEYYDEIYEAWLVDVDTGYTYSLGLFLVDQDGYARFSYTVDNYADPYDMIVVTKEIYPDNDPRPNGEIVLVGYFDTSSLTHSTESTDQGVTRYQYKQYGEDADEVYG